jgi:hypothetical protein
MGTNPSPQLLHLEDGRLQLVGIQVRPGQRLLKSDIWWLIIG